MHEIASVIRVDFGLPSFRAYARLGKVAGREGTVFGLEAPRHVMNSLGHGITGGHMIPYYPRKHKYVDKSELEWHTDDGKSRPFYPEDDIILEMLDPTGNRAYSIPIVMNRETGVYELKLSIFGIVKKQPCHRSLVPLLRNLGEQHNHSLSKEEQKRFGTFRYSEERRLYSDAYQTVLSKHFSESKIRGSSKVISLVTAFDIIEEVKRNMEPEAFRLSQIQPRQVNPEIKILDGSRTYVRTIANPYSSLGALLKRGAMNWKTVAEESAENSLYHSLAVPDIKKNSSTARRMRLELECTWVRRDS